MGVCKKIKRRADQERNVWELFRMFKNEKKILGLSESTLQNYEDSLKRFMDYMECTDAPIQEIDYDDVLSFTQGLQEEELSAGAFYTRDNLPEIPKKLSIARRLIDAWIEGKI